jgi:hypothetical protein
VLPLAEFGAAIARSMETEEMVPMAGTTDKGTAPAPASLARHGTRGGRPGLRQLQWSYSEGGFGGSVNFAINADGGSDFNFNDPNQLGTGGSGIVRVYNEAGTHYLTISSEGNWTIKVVTAP